MSRNRLRLGTRVGLGVAFFLASLTGVGLFERLELRTYDLRLAWRGPRTSRARVVVAAIDETCERTWNEPRVAWGERYANILLHARQAGAAWVGLDVLQRADVDGWLEEIGGKGHPDAALAEALIADPDRSGLGYKQLGPKPVMPNEVLWTSDPANEVARNLGFIDLAVRGYGLGNDEGDDAVRREPLDLAAATPSDPDGVKPSLVALGAARVRGLDPLSGRDLRKLVPEGTLVEGHGGEAFWINDLGRPVPRVSAWRLERGELTSEDRRLLKGASVLIGETLTGTDDIYVGPGRKWTTGVDIHAQSLATLLDGRPLRRSMPVAEALATLMMGLLGVLAWTRPRPALRGALSTGLGLSYVAVAFLAYRSADILFPLVGVGLTLLAMPLAVGAARAVEERVERARVERVFGAQVGIELRDFMLQPGWGHVQGGFETVATVLFADLRGSTAMAHDLSAATVVATLNAFFDTIVPCVEARGGIVLSFLGDGLIAVFGVPLPLPDPNHARHAVETARAMLEAMEGLNARRQSEGLVALRMGCGVHTGALVCGNLGSRERLQLTVVGDTVNTAARLENASKELGVRAVVSTAAMGHPMPGEGCPVRTR